MMTTVIYLRTSTDEQNPENQLKDCISINKFGEYELVEDKQSAWKESDRDGFESIRKRISKGNIKHLICWDLDRLYRNRKKLIEFFDYCKHYDCKIHSARQSWLEELNKIPSPFDEVMHNLMLQVMGWLAEEESNKKSERVRNAIRMTDEGAFSYKGNKWGRKELSLQAINKILELKSQGLSIRDIAKQVQYSDKNKNLKNVSIGVVHKVVSGNHRKISSKPS